MPPLDASASDIALGQLQALPFENIIGAPLVAAIQAQGLAADSSVDFIEAIGLQGPPGQLEAINVKFSYMDGTGAVRILSVPLLTIVPIPLIAIDTIDIQFKARITGSAQQASEESQSSGGGVSGGGSLGWRRKRFRAAVSLNAGYSSKKDSKASQDSRYSVEYTMDVHVHASQAGLPQGMAQLLNILQDGISSSPPDQLQVLGLPLSIPWPAQATTLETFTVMALDAPGGDPLQGYAFPALAFDPPGILAGTVAGTNPWTVTLTKATGASAPTGNTDVTITITAAPSTQNSPLKTLVAVRIVTLVP